MKFDYETYNKIFHPTLEPAAVNTGAVEPIKKTNKQGTKQEPVEKEPLKNDEKSGVAKGPEVAETEPEEGTAGTPKDGGIDDGVAGTCETDS